MGNERETSIYIHIPYCVRKCPYCDFASVPCDKPPERDYTSAVAAELRSRADEIEGKVNSVYIGGGTPSLFSPDGIMTILSAVRACADVSADAEISMEMNPGTLRHGSAAGYAAAGINRVSVGAQSLNDGILRVLGRVHTAEDVRRTIGDLREAGFRNINADFLYAVAERDSQVRRSDLESLIALGTEHISPYCLSIYDGTPFALAGRRESPGDAAADEFDELRDRLAEAGYEHYEISNFAESGRRCRHNELYWRRGAYLGLGASAVSFQAAAKDAPYGLRKKNIDDPSEYMRRIRSDGHAIVESEAPTFREALGETIFLGLRRLDGISTEDIGRRFDISFADYFRKEISELAAAGLIEHKDERVCLTPRGLFLSDEVFQHFI